MTETKWENPNAFFLTIRCMEKRYADSFIDHGCLKFNTPRSWEEYAEEGRGDVYEGTLAFYSKTYPFQGLLKDKYSGAYQYKLSERILLKNHRDMNLPCLCFYTAKLSDFVVPSKEGVQKINSEIAGKYFRDFADHMTQEEAEKLAKEDPDKQPAMVVIQDFDKFFIRLKKKLLELGIKEEQILAQQVCYENFDKYGKIGSYMDFNMKRPYELFVKSDKFKHQNELRVIIDTDNPEQLKIFESPINIGNLSDIAKKSVGYHPAGIIVEGKADIKLTD
jgi:hypothetical protein